MIGLELPRLLLSFLFWGSRADTGGLGHSTDCGVCSTPSVECVVWRHSLAWLKDSKENVLKAQV